MQAEVSPPSTGRAAPLGRFTIAFAAAAVVVCAVMALVGSTSGSAPTSEPLGRAERVVIVSVPGLRWQDLVATDTPALDRLIGHAATMSVRAMGPTTSPLEGYLTIGAGNRLEPGDPGDRGAGSAAALVDERCLPAVLAGAQAAADDELNGAVAGALGARLRDEGVRTEVYGSTDAIAALMDADGCVDRFGTAPPAALATGVTLIEFGGLADTDVAAARSEALADLDGRLGSLALPDDALVIVLAPAAPFDRAEVVVVGVRRPTGASGFGSLVSPTTRRADYVTLADVAPAVLAAVGTPERELPESMSGTEIRATTSDADGQQAHQAELADLAERVILRDRAVGPVSVLLVVLLVLCAVAALGRRARLSRMLAPIVMAYPSVSFATGLVAYHQLPLGFLVVMIAVVSIVLASVAVSSLARFGAWAPVGGLAVLLWVLLVIDICTGGSLQINTPLGYTPTVAGRFQGFGNLSFGLVGASAVCVVAVGMYALARVAADGRPAPVPATWVAATVGAITAMAVALPAFGSDVGGTLAIVPTFAVVVAMVAGRRLGWRPALVAGGVTVALVGILAAVDLARPASSRTHLGRFLDDLLRGDGGLVIRRKLRANLAIFTSSFWSFVLVAVLIVLFAVAWRRRDTVLPEIRRRAELRVFLVGFTIVAVLGFALNDSGLAVPSIMMAVAVPWLVSSLIPVVKRSRGEAGAS